MELFLPIIVVVVGATGALVVYAWIVAGRAIERERAAKARRLKAPPVRAMADKPFSAQEHSQEGAPMLDRDKILSAGKAHDEAPAREQAEREAKLKREASELAQLIQEFLQLAKERGLEPSNFSRTKTVKNGPFGTKQVRDESRSYHGYQVYRYEDLEYSSGMCRDIVKTTDVDLDGGVRRDGEIVSVSGALAAHSIGRWKSLLENYLISGQTKVEKG